jgi:TonB-dependent starch-binding outer membrane protein SusC
MTKIILFKRIRLITFLLVCSSVGVMAQVLAKDQNQSSKQKQTLPINKTNLSQLLDNLEDTYKVRFNYKASLLKNVQVEATSIQEFKGQIDNKLNELLSAVNLKCEVINANSFVIIPIEKIQKEVVNPKQKITEQSPNASTLADITVTGKIVDENGEGIPGVSIIVKGTTRGTTTNAKGEYSIDVPDENSIISLSSIGYETQSVKVGNRKIINVSLSTSTKGLSEVVVVGYGTRKKDELVGAVTTINSSVLTKQLVISFDQALAGLVPGMTIRDGSGAPGAGPEILIRGINTFGTNRPLIVIDDVIFENYNDPNNNPLALLNPEDIENVSVLKDAGTKSIYGSRATAGVIIVTTKKGKAGTPKFTFGASYGFGKALGFEDPNMMNATELAQFRKEVAIDRLRGINTLYKDPTVPVPDAALPASAAAFLDPSQYGVGTNWYNEVTQVAGTLNYNLSISGGTDVVKYFVSGSYLKQEGIVKFTDLARFSLNAKIDLNLTKNFKIGVNLAPARTLQNRPSNEPAAGGFSAYSTITSTYWSSPEAKVFDANGNYNYLTISPLTTNWGANPLYRLQAETEDRLANQLIMGTYAEYSPIPNLTLKTQLSYSNIIRRTNSFSPSAVPADGLTPLLPNLSGARASTYNEDFSNLIFDNTATYRLLKNKHNVTAMIGTSYQDSKTESVSVNAKRLLDENLKLPIFSNVEKTVNDNYSGSTGFGQNRLVGYFTRLNYIYDGKYFLNASFRRDGSSRFGRAMKYGDFPSVSIAWRPLEEGFLKNIVNKNIIDDLRIEGGYGVTGNQQIANAANPNYVFLGGVTQSNYIFGGVSTLGNTLGSIPNDGLTWEESRQVDFGLNASMFRKRLTIAANIYRTETVGLFNQIPVPNITGTGSVIGNSGRMENKGFEVDVAGQIVKRKNFNWNMSVNVSKYNNKILDLVNGVFYSGTAGNGSPVAISEVGQPVGMYYGLKILGLYSQAEIDDVSKNEKGLFNVPKYAGAAVGTIKYLDGNGNGILESGIADAVVLANPHPDLMFGWSNQISAYGFSIRAVFAGQFGGSIFDLRRELMYNVDGNFNVSRDLQNRWRPGDPN